MHKVKRFSYVIILPLLLSLGTYAFYMASHVSPTGIVIPESSFDPLKPMNMFEIYEYWKQKGTQYSINVGVLSTIAAVIIGCFDFYIYSKKER
ncbi:hypothetical protein POF51_26080 [Brevibacillus sp. AG]|uniref:hypothetical protein n=1 Tax=Brevibacillus sp. AG TaxID=3020891 RepID=UPI0023312E96|nr:hypothetical protein [Brevibacillus sp. AG]MDC0764193.1 hypothetical protein [Brevibacillus sp. AG]